MFGIGAGVQLVSLRLVGFFSGLWCKCRLVAGVSGFSPDAGGCRGPPDCSCDE